MLEAIMSQRLRIALAVESSRCFGRDLLAGIAAYARTYGPWSLLYQERSIESPLPPAVKRWRPQGLIARIVDGRAGRRVRSLGVPAVDLLDVVRYAEIPRVLWNSEAIARMAVEHLLDRGHRQFGYVGFHGVRFSDERRRAMCQYLAGKGFSARVFEEHGSRHVIGECEADAGSQRQVNRLGAWLAALPKPIGLMACNDVRAQHVLNACGERGIPVPEAVAVVGVDNDPTLCQLCDPPLSSVDPNAQRIGYEAAGLLHRMIAGERPAAHDLLIDPVGVVARRSTDALAIADPVVIEVDFGTQRGLFCSLESYRRLFKPFHRAINDRIHKLTSWKTFIHSCGAVFKLIPDLIDAGFDVLNPVQCSAAGMDPRQLKAEFGRDVVFWGGGVDTQTTLPFGTPAEVYRQVRERIDIFAPGGGFVFNSVHNVQSNVPLENILAMFQAIWDSNTSQAIARPHFEDPRWQRSKSSQSGARPGTTRRISG
jgi:LacI family transcriptional regulator